jgi:hypothetical protein
MAVDDSSRDDEPEGSSACGRCHSCLARLTAEDWCPECHAFRRYYEHGYGYRVAELERSCEAALEGRSLPLQHA